MTRHLKLLASLAAIAATGPLAAQAAPQTPISAAQTVSPAPATRGGPLTYYELRTYFASPGKLDAVKQEFTSWIIPGLRRAGIQVVGYWERSDEKPGVVYMMAFKNKAERDAAWAFFRADPETSKGRAADAATHTDGVRPIASTEIIFLGMTSFSPHPKTAQGVPLQ